MKVAGTWDSLENVPPYPMFGQKSLVRRDGEELLHLGN